MLNLGNVTLGRPPSQSQSSPQCDPNLSGKRDHQKPDNLLHTTVPRTKELFAGLERSWGHPNSSQGYLHRSESTVNKSTSSAVPPGQKRRHLARDNQRLSPISGHQNPEASRDVDNPDLDSHFRCGKAGLDKSQTHHGSPDPEQLLSNSSPQTRDMENRDQAPARSQSNLGHQVRFAILVPQSSGAQQNSTLDEVPTLPGGIPDSSNAVRLESEQFVVSSDESTYQGETSSNGNTIGVVCGRHLDPGDICGRCPQQNGSDNQSPDIPRTQTEHQQMLSHTKSGSGISGPKDQPGNKYDLPNAGKTGCNSTSCEGELERPQDSAPVRSQSGGDAFGTDQMQPRSAWVPPADHALCSPNGEFPLQQSPQCVPSMECPTNKDSRAPGSPDRSSQLPESHNSQSLPENLQSQIPDLYRCKRSRVGSLSENRGKGDKIRRFAVDGQAETSAQHSQRGSGHISCDQVPNPLCAGRLHTGDSHGLPINNVAVEQRLENPISHQHNLETSPGVTPKEGFLLRQTCPRSFKSQSRLVIPKQRSQKLQAKSRNLRRSLPAFQMQSHGRFVRQPAKQTSPPVLLLEGGSQEFGICLGSRLEPRGGLVQSPLGTHSPDFGQDQARSSQSPVLSSELEGTMVVPNAASTNVPGPSHLQPGTFVPKPQRGNNAPPRWQTLFCTLQG